MDITKAESLYRQLPNTNTSLKLFWTEADEVELFAEKATYKSSYYCRNNESSPGSHYRTSGISVVSAASHVNTCAIVLV